LSVQLRIAWYVFVEKTDRLAKDGILKLLYCFGLFAVAILYDLFKHFVSGDFGISVPQSVFNHQRSSTRFI